MVIVSESVRGLKGFLQKTGLNEFAMAMLLRMVVAFISHPGRMSCSAAAGSIASEAVHRGQLTRFLARTRWQKLIFSTTKPNLKAATPDDVKITTVLFLEHERARHLADRRLSQERRQWWETRRLHGLCSAFRKETAGRELKYLSDRLKTSGGIEKLKRLIAAALPKEFRVAG